MKEVMRHEKFYEGSEYVDEGNGVYFGWLAHPKTLGACMPLVSADKRFLIVIVGEHFPQFRTIHTANGPRLSEEAECELLSLYEESEDKFLRYLNGWFCGFAVDRRIGKVTLFNDRYGMGRIYWHESQDEFLQLRHGKRIAV
jgi:asparagine synthase (glutamine-hydrolysing)